METDREWQLVARPQGWPRPDDFALVDREVPEPGPGDLLVRNIYMSVDPYMRGRMNAARSYVPPFELGETMTGGAVGQVVSSRSERVPEGAYVRHQLGWREMAVCPGEHAEVVDPAVAPLPAYLGVMGMPGLTAYVGLFDIGEVKPGETVFVSAASGAVGSIVGQLALDHGCRVIGSAGSTEKVRYLTEELGFHRAFDYHDGDVTEQLRDAAPDGIDVHFENVGGDHLRAALDSMNWYGRIAVCGLVAHYNETRPGPDNLFHIVAKRLKVQGFIIRDHGDRASAFTDDVGGMIRDGRLRYRETIYDGIDQALQALLDMLEGGHHIGKMVVRLAPDPTG